MAEDERFEILGTLGKGGMGSVYRARDRETGEIVAIKELHALFVDDPGYVARFEREVEVARRINSPNVVRVLGYGRREETPYMVMEYVEGESLRELLGRRGKLDWAETKVIAAQVAEGLRAAHRVGVIHRDIKPSNILITNAGVVKLADFGIARATDMTRLTGAATMLGTPAYMAPENTTSPQTDLYALGCVMYEMLEGRPPFEGDSQQEILVKHMRERPNIEALPPAARRIVGNLLQKSPQRRPASATALLVQLETDGERTQVEPEAAALKPPRQGPPGPPTNKRPLLFAGGSILGAMAIALVVILGPCNSGDDTPVNPDKTATPTATVTSGSTAVRTSTSAPTSAPTTRPTQTAPTPTPTPPAAKGPKVLSSDWSPSNAKWNDAIKITLKYQSGDAPITQVQLHEVGTNRNGGPIVWPSVSNTSSGASFNWDGQNYLQADWDLAANTTSTYTLTLYCNSPQSFRSNLYITFIDANGNASQDNIGVTFICSQTGN